MSRAIAIRSSVLLSLCLTALPAGALAQVELAQVERAQADAPASETAATAASEPRLGRSSTVFTPSLLATYGGGASGELGVGLHLRLDHYPTRYAVRLGGFVSAEVQTDGSVRIAGGLANAMWLFGCEIGLAYRTDTGRYASSLGLHIGKSIVLGPVTIGGRVTIPLADFIPAQDADGARVQGIEGALVITVGLPTTLDGPERRAFDCGGHGHPTAR